MTATREQGQSRASAEALEALMEASRNTSDARCEVARVQRELREARKALKASELAEQAADARYLATPYADADA